MAQANLALGIGILKGLLTADGRDEAVSGVVRVILKQGLMVAQGVNEGAGIQSHFSRNVLDICPERLKQESRESLKSQLYLDVSAFRSHSGGGSEPPTALSA